MKLAREGHERAERLGFAQGGDMRGDGRGKTLADQTGARAGLRKLACVFQIVEKYQVGRSRFVERSKPVDPETGARGIHQMRTCQRRDVSQRRRRGLLEERWLRHSIRCGLAGGSTSE